MVEKKDKRIKKKIKLPSKSKVKKPKKTEYIETTQRVKKTHIIPCTNCGMEMEVDLSVITVLCGNCTMIKTIKLYGPPKGCEPKKNEGPKKPPGWHFYKEFVDKDGKVYHKGIEQPELFETMDPTVIKPKKKSKHLSIREKEEKQKEIFKEIQKNKRALHKLVKAGKNRGQKCLIKKIQSLTREVKKYIKR